jgi:hypothetical protein
VGVAGSATAATYAAGAAVNVILASSSTPSGGWCTFLKHPAGTPLTNADAGAIHDYVHQQLVNGLGPINGLINPIGLNLIAGTMAAIDSNLASMIASGSTCDQIPNDLTALPGVKQPDKPSDVIGNVVTNLIDWTGLGSAMSHVAVLVVILAVIVLGAWRLLK